MEIVLEIIILIHDSKLCMLKIQNNFSIFQQQEIEINLKAFKIFQILVRDHIMKYFNGVNWYKIKLKFVHLRAFFVEII